MPRLRLTRIADVTAESVSWLWPGYIPQGKLTLLDGDPEATSSRPQTGQGFEQSLEIEDFEFTCVGAPPSHGTEQTRFVAAIGSIPAMISPETRPRPSRADAYSIPSKNARCPRVCALPGQIAANTSGSSNS